MQGGGYCFGGPHPAPGGGWEATATPHVHNYAPFDLRLFSYHNGCYYFIGDPRDFGYTGQPTATTARIRSPTVTAAAGASWSGRTPTGGGPGRRTSPWSAPGTTGTGPTIPFFWAYWPFYSFYYRSYYPRYYAGGRYLPRRLPRGAADHARPGVGRGGLARGAGGRRRRLAGRAPGGASSAGRRRLPRRRPAYHGAPWIPGGWHGGAGPLLRARGGGGRRLPRRRRRLHGGGGGGGFHIHGRSPADGRGGHVARGAAQLFPCGKKLSSYENSV